MKLPSFLFFIICGHWSRRQLARAGALLLLLLTTCMASAAVELSPPGYTSILPEATFVGLPAGTEEDDGATATGTDTSEFKDGAVPLASSSPDISDLVSDVEATSGESHTPAVSADKRAPDWDGIWRDTAILAGAQAIAAAILFVTPESVSNWSDEDKKSTFRKYNDNFMNPEIDDDKAYINYVLHPYWGAAYYIRGRERGLNQTSSFIFSTLISAMYEFGIECIFENPSIQDLIVTPVAGSLIGAYIFEPWRESIKRKEELRWYDHAGLIVTDPIGILSLGVEKMFGIKPTITVDYSVPKSTTRSSEPVIGSNDHRIGVVMKFRFN